MGVSYTAQAENALVLAGRTARQCHHSYIGTEHLLMGLLKEASGTAGMVLAEYGVNEERLMELIDRLIAPSVRRLRPSGPDIPPEQSRCWKRRHRRRLISEALLWEQSIF